MFDSSLASITGTGAVAEFVIHDVDVLRCRWKVTMAAEFTSF